MRRLPFAIFSLWAWTLAPAAMASGPADDLLKLIPADSGLVLAIEDFRGQSRSIAESPLFRGLETLPTVRAFLDSNQFRRIDRAAREIQRALGITIETIRDDLLGDAVVFVLQPGPSGKPDQSHGLLLVLPRNRALIEPLIGGLNQAQIKSGELRGVDVLSRGPVKYSVRRYKAAGRPAEFYALLDNGAFAWTNSEAIIHGVIDRKLGGADHHDLGSDPAFQKVRRGLPAHPLASLFINPSLVERALADSARPDGPSTDRVISMLTRYFGSMGRAGLAIEWRDGLMLHSHEVIDPNKLDPWLKRWLARPASPVNLLGQVPASAVAVLSARIDFESVRDAIWESIPEADRPGLDNYRLGLQGILLGLDPLNDVLPRLSPGTLLYADLEPEPSVKPRFPIVGVLGWSDQPGAEDLAGPIDNAMRTAFALHALAPRPRSEHVRVEPRKIGDARLTVLTDGHRPLMTYRVEQKRLALGNSPEAVARFGTGQPPRSLASLREKYFPEAETFAMADLDRLVTAVRSLRGPIAQRLANHSKRPVAAVDRDLGHLISMAELFRAATFTTTSTPDASEIHRNVHLIAH